MAKELPEYLSVDDAVALIVNISFIPGGTSVLQMLSFFKEEAEYNYDLAENWHEKNRYKAYIEVYANREKLAESLYNAIDAELACNKEGKKSEIEIAENTFGKEKLVTASVCSWASDMGFGIQGWHPPRFWRRKNERTYSTPYLDIIDHVIATFCEENGEHYQAGQVPKKEAVMAWINEKYGPLSEKVIDVIATIIRPGLTKPPEKKIRKK